MNEIQAVCAVIGCLRWYALWLISSHDGHNISSFQYERWCLRGHDSHEWEGQDNNVEEPQWLS